MATLGEILGGIIRDVAQARSLADLLACESARAYAADGLLSAFPVPRVAVKDVAIKLRFAVDALAEQDLREEAEAEAREIWKGELATKLLPRVVALGVDAETLRSASDSILRARTPGFGLAAALNGKLDRMVRETKSFLTAAISQLPLETRRRLGNVRAAAAHELPAAVDSFVFRARQLVNAKAAANTELQVLVTKADLEKAPEQTIHEFTFTLTLDDFHVTGPAAAPRKEVS